MSDLFILLLYDPCTSVLRYPPFALRILDASTEFTTGYVLAIFCDTFLRFMMFLMRRGVVLCFDYDLILSTVRCDLLALLTSM